MASPGHRGQALKSELHSCSYSQSLANGTHGGDADRARSESVHSRITSLTARDASGADLAELARGQWSIEDRLHWVRDVSYDEDRSQVRTGNGPCTLASLRNFAISAVRLTGVTNIAASIRYQARRRDRPLQVIKSL